MKTMRHAKTAMWALPVLLASTLLAACGGGGSSRTDADPDDPTLADRRSAATTTATTHPRCATSVLGSFYWEVGDANGVLAGGSVGPDAPQATTPMSIASASKWLYSAYVVQRVGVREADVPFLNFTSGYTQFLLPLCQPTDTVASCIEGKDDLVPETVGRFFYGSGHMQHHAATSMGLGSLTALPLGQELRSVIGDHDFVYSQPQLAGGVVGSAAGYGSFLRRILRRELAIGAALGSHKVCTNPRTCPSAMVAPVPDTESWSYSLGHWVEDDPAVGDGAFSSPGAFGFYPWIDAARTTYGILARRDDDSGGSNPGYESTACGRLIRQAWMTGIPAAGDAPKPVN
jgi:hypothetical protein